MSEDWVYVIQRGSHIKIGTSTNPKERVQHLARDKSGCVMPDVVQGEAALLTVVSGDKDTEGLLHLAFADQRVGGEWFAVEGPVKRFVTELERRGLPTSTSAATNITVRLGQELLEEIDEIAKTEQRTRGDMIRILLADGLKSYRRKHA